MHAATQPARQAQQRGRRPIGLAAAAGKLLEVERLLEEGVDVNEPDDFGETALHMACMEGQKVVVQMLVIEQVARLDVRNWEGWTPMVWATVRGHSDIVKFLADRGSSLQWRSNLGWTPLHFAAMMSNLPLVEWMLDEGASALAMGEDGCMPGDCAIHPEVRQRLFKTVTHIKLAAGEGKATIEAFLGAKRMSHVLEDTEVQSSLHAGPAATPSAGGAGRATARVAAGLQAPRMASAMHSSVDLAESPVRSQRFDRAPSRGSSNGSPAVTEMQLRPLTMQDVLSRGRGDAASGAPADQRSGSLPDSHTVSSSASEQVADNGATCVVEDVSSSAFVRRTSATRIRRPLPDQSAAASSTPGAELALKAVGGSQCGTKAVTAPSDGAFVALPAGDARRIKFTDRSHDNSCWTTTGTVSALHTVGRRTGFADVQAMDAWGESEARELEPLHDHSAIVPTMHFRSSSAPARADSRIAFAQMDDGVLLAHSPVVAAASDQVSGEIIGGDSPIGCVDCFTDAGQDAVIGEFLSQLGG